MRPRILALLLAVLVLTCLATTPLACAQDFPGQMRKLLDAWETLNPNNAAAFYAKEANRAFFDIAPLKYAGWSEYSEGVKKLLADFASLKFTLANDVQVQRAGSTAWATATFRAEAAMKNGAKESFDGRWTIVWEKRGKDWLVVHEHVSVPVPEPPAGEQSLYKRLGGYDALAAVVDDFIGRLATDKQLGRFFDGHSTESLRRIRQLVVDQLCAAAGGPCYYTGRTMKASHEGLGITDADWQIGVNHLGATLDKFKVPERERKEVTAAISALRKDIVTSAK